MIATSAASGTTTKAFGHNSSVANDAQVPEKDQIDILISTDVLSEGQNLQDCGVIINYDLLHSLPDQHAQILKDWVAKQFLILDESHYVKSKKARRTKFVFEYLAPSKGGGKAVE